MAEPTGIEDAVTDPAVDDVEGEGPSEYTTETAQEPTFAGVPAAAGFAGGTGRRKKAIARVRLAPGAGQWRINGKPLEDYFPDKVHQQIVSEPLRLLGLADGSEIYDVNVRVTGGGTSGQAGAVCHGLARALASHDPENNRPTLKKAGLLTRDSREIERKKAGLKKARKAPQYSKR